MLNELTTSTFIFFLPTSLFGLAFILFRLVGYYDRLLVFLLILFVSIVEHTLVILLVWLSVFQKLVGLKQYVFEGKGGVCREGRAVVGLV